MTIWYVLAGLSFFAFLFVWSLCSSASHADSRRVEPVRSRGKDPARSPRDLTNPFDGNEAA